MEAGTPELEAVQHACGLLAHVAIAWQTTDYSSSDNFPWMRVNDTPAKKGNKRVNACLTASECAVDTN